MGEQLKNKVTRLGFAGALTALSLAAVAVPAHASALPSPDDPCGPLVGSVKICAAMDGWTYEVPVTRAPLAPLPRIGGVPQVGNTLTVFDGVWEPRDATFTHQWLRSDVPILGAVETTYQLTEQDLGNEIRVATTATAPGFKKTHRSAKPVPVAAAGGSIPTVPAPTKVSISGGATNPAQVGEKVSVYATWTTPGVRVHYQWLRAGKPIPGANGSAYLLTDADVGTMVRAAITGYAPGFNPITVTSGSKPIHADSTPGAVVTGGTEPGQVLTGVQRPWGAGWGADRRYQWLREGAEIPGATTLSYTITAADQGTTLVLRTDTSAYSNPVAVPPPANPKQLTNLTKPVLTGGPAVGVPMTVSAGTWSEPAKNLSVSYRWSYDGKILSSHADGSTYTPGWGSVHRTISVRVTVTAPGYSPARITVTSSRLLRPEPQQTWGPVILELPVVGKVVPAQTPGWTEGEDAQGNRARVVNTFQWLRDGVPIPGADRVGVPGARYKPVAADVGKKLSLRVTSTFLGKTLKIQTVDAAAKVTALPAVSGIRPRVTGTAKAGSVLTAVPIVVTKHVALKYQWLRNGGPIVNATAATYKVQTADKGAMISVRVTGTLAGYDTSSWESDAVTAS